MTRTFLAGAPARRLRLLSRHFVPSALPTLPLSLQLLSRSIASSARALKADADLATGSSTTAAAAWTFTTSAAFHGKPVSRSRRSGPDRGNSDSHDGDGDSRSSPAASVKQGLAADHPLCKWRDQYLAEGKAPKEVGAGHDWWFVEGVPPARAPARGASGTRGVVLGVAGAGNVSTSESSPYWESRTVPR